MSDAIIRRFIKWVKSIQQHKQRTKGENKVQRHLDKFIGTWDAIMDMMLACVCKNTYCTLTTRVPPIQILVFLNDSHLPNSSSFDLGCRRQSVQHFPFAPTTWNGRCRASHYFELSSSQFLQLNAQFSSREQMGWEQCTMERRASGLC